ncbi:predicted protein [Sclerotinia sclerotiorum 1980 UF-70]|uniref:Uncharacterized protein n=1 Tax=Sclerotinia sclerotiorum (strain ATCC 18683 / 1980 / Ss-1) TaxID=665079 RepID=A7ENG4_SCLS1|nr:predicted protein [Sclerotinia sclerotiorum 1980 UF-70]EDO04380.1 predicted protein [Sclerotinia sclerotiorum 1980 UF-70]
MPTSASTSKSNPHFEIKNSREISIFPQTPQRISRLAIPIPISTLIPISYSSWKSRSADMRKGHLIQKLSPRKPIAQQRIRRSQWTFIGNFSGTSPTAHPSISRHSGFHFLVGRFHRASTDQGLNIIHGKLIRTQEIVSLWLVKHEPKNSRKQGKAKQSKAKQSKTRQGKSFRQERKPHGPSMHDADYARNAGSRSKRAYA